MKMIEKGSMIEYVDGFGMGTKKQARIERIELVPAGEKYGNQIASASLDEVMKTDNYILSLDNGKWAYGNQVMRLINVSN